MSKQEETRTKPKGKISKNADRYMPEPRKPRVRTGEIHAMAEKGDLDGVKRQLMRGEKPNDRDGNGFTVAMWAFLGRQPEVLDFLLDRGADLESVPPGKWAHEYWSADDPVQVEMVKMVMRKRSSGRLRDIVWDRDTESLCKLAKAGVAKELFNDALRHACRNQIADMVPVLLECGANPNGHDDQEGTSALHVTCMGPIDEEFARTRKVRPELVKLLIDRGANTELKNSKGQTPLHRAIEDGDTFVAEALVKNGASVTATTDSGETALHLIAKHGSEKLAKLAFDKGADVNAHDNEGNTPLDIVAPIEFEVKELLIEHGARRATTTEPKSASAQPADPLPPLHQAAKDGNVEEVKRLLAEGADVNARDDNRATALHIAAAADQVEVARMLLEKGVWINAIDKEWKRPIHHAAEEGSKRVLKFLLDNNAKMNVHDAEGATPLHCATLTDDHETAEILLKAGIWWEETDDYNNTAQQSAEVGECFEVAEFLNKWDKTHGDKDQEEGFRFTQLEDAMYESDIEGVRKALRDGADIESPNEDNRPPLIQALELVENAAEIARMLIEAGADVNCVDGQGRTAIQVAKEEGADEIVELLKSKGGIVPKKRGRRRESW